MFDDGHPTVARLAPPKAHPGSRRRLRRRVSPAAAFIARLGAVVTLGSGVALDASLDVVADGLGAAAELSNALAHAVTDLGQALGAEQQQGDQQDHDDLWRTEIEAEDGAHVCHLPDAPGPRAAWGNPTPRLG